MVKEDEKFQREMRNAATFLRSQQMHKVCGPLFTSHTSPTRRVARHCWNATTPCSACPSRIASKRPPIGSASTCHSRRRTRSDSVRTRFGLITSLQSMPFEDRATALFRQAIDALRPSVVYRYADVHACPFGSSDICSIVTDMSTFLDQRAEWK